MAKQSASSAKNSRINWGKLALELFVVFLGVTAGFVLNNWRTTSTERKVEQNYIKNFYQDAKSNRNELTQILKNDSLWFARAKPILNLMVSGSLPLDSALVATQLISEIRTPTFVTSTYQNITNSGSLNIISDLKIREQIVVYHIIIKEGQYLNDIFISSFNQHILPFLLSEVNIVKSTFINPKGPDINKISNTLALFYSMIEQRSALYKQLLKSGEELENELNTKIKN